MAQLAYPVSLVSNSGWAASSGSTFYDLVDEVTPDHADYVYSAWAGSTNTIEFGLTSLSQPASGTGQISFWALVSAIGPFVNPFDLQVDLYEGATLIKTSTTDVGTYTTATNITVNLTSGDVAGITDWSDLRFRVSQTDGDIGAADLRLTQIQLSVPNAASGSGAFDVTAPLHTVDVEMFDSPNPSGLGLSQDILVEFSDLQEYYGDDRIWYCKPDYGDRGYRICVWCGRKVPPSKATEVNGKWYCPDDIPTNYDKGPNAWIF